MTKQEIQEYMINQRLIDNNTNNDNSVYKRKHTAP